MSAPIEVFFFPTVNGWKVTIALEEMGFPYTLTSVNIRAGDQHRPDFVKLSPNHRMPAIIDPDGPDGKPISIFESGAILLYLGRKSGQFYPEDPRARAEVEQWLMWQLSGLGPMTGQLGHFLIYAPLLAENPDQLTYARDRYDREVKRLYGVLNERLEGRDFIAGDYSIADMATWPFVIGHSFMKLDIGEFPNIKHWLDRVGARPAVQRGRAAGADFAAQTSQISVAEKAASLKALFGREAAVAKT